MIFLQKVIIFVVESGGGSCIYDLVKQQTDLFFPQLIQKLTDVAEECQNNQLKKLKEICEK